MPTTSGMPAFATAARLSPSASGNVKSMATSAFARACSRSAVTATAIGPAWAISPASRPRAELEGDASAPVSTKSGDSRIARTRQRPTRPLIPSTATFVISAAHPAEELAHALEPGALARIMAPAVRSQRALELAEQIFLLRAELHGRLDDHAAEKIARRTAADRADALLPQPEHAARLRSRRHLDRRLAFERRNVDAAAEGRGCEADRNLAGQVSTVTLEDRVLANHDLDVEVAWRPAVPARFAFARKPDPVARVDARWHLHGEPLAGPRAPLPRALRARVRDDRAASLAAWAGLLHGED